MRLKTHSHSNNRNRSQRLISLIIGPSLPIFFSLVLKGILRDSHSTLFHVIFFVYEYELQFLKRTADIVFRAVIFILRKNIDIETITPLRENTHIQTERPVYHVSEISVRT